MKAKALSAVATVLLLAVMAVALPFSVPKLFGYQIYNVLTQSMEPAMPVGSAIYVKRCDPQALRQGEIITYRLSEATGLVQTHRVVENDTQAKQLITKGDANALPDVDPVSYERVVGKVVICIPVLGTVSEMLHSGPGVTACVAIFALAIILWTLADKTKKRERSK
ncbi:signal peptidase I [Allofournierella massiliensis]|uniref:signal peptidase I n=1 Tax=Allofournierella massiliensis TaxID=1650663 RepID=UPI003568846B